MKIISKNRLQQGLNSIKSTQFSSIPLVLQKLAKIQNFQESVLIFLTKEQFHTYGCSVQLHPTLCDLMDGSMSGFPVHHQLPRILKVLAIRLVMPSNHLIFCHSLLLLPSVFPSISLFWWVDSSKQAAKVLDFSISPCNEYSGLISFRVDWFDLLALQGTLKSLLQHHNSKASIPWCSAFFLVQLSHPYITTGKTIALTIRTCVTK